MDDGFVSGLQVMKDQWMQKNPAVTLERISHIAGINEDKSTWKDIQIDLEQPDGIYAFFCIAALYNVMGGGEGKITRFRKNYARIMARDFENESSTYRSLYQTLSHKVKTAGEGLP